MKLCVGVCVLTLRALGQVANTSRRQAVALVATGSKAKVKEAVRNPKGWASSAYEHSCVRSDVFTNSA